MLRRKKEILFSVLFLAGIGAGTVIGIWQRDWLTEQISVYQTLFLLQFSQIETADYSYLLFLLRIRGIEIATLFVLSFTGWYRRALLAITAAVGMWFGVFIAGLTFCYGFRGFAVFGSTIFPHYLIDGFGCILLYEFSCKRDRFQPAEKGLIAFQIAAVFAVGVLGEYWVQPGIMKWTMNRL